MKEIIDIIACACDNNIVKKNMDIDLFETGLLDSMTFIELLVELEEEYGIEIKPQDVKRDILNTPRAIIDYIGIYK